MCQILGQILEVKSLKNSRGEVYFLIKFLLNDNHVSILFFKDEELYNKFNNLERLTDINLYCDILYKDENSFRLIPKSFEM